jgi:hypothetical protein
MSTEDHTHLIKTIHRNPKGRNTKKYFQPHILGKVMSLGWGLEFGIGDLGFGVKSLEFDS